MDMLFRDVVLVEFGAVHKLTPRFVVEEYPNAILQPVLPPRRWEWAYEGGCVLPGRGGRGVLRIPFSKKDFPLRFVTAQPDADAWQCERCHKRIEYSLMDGWPYGQPNEYEAGRKAKELLKAGKANPPVCPGCTAKANPWPEGEAAFRLVQVRAKNGGSFAMIRRAPKGARAEGHLAFVQLGGGYKGNSRMLSVEGDARVIARKWVRPWFPGRGRAEVVALYVYGPCSVEWERNGRGCGGPNYIAGSHLAKASYDGQQWSSEKVKYL